MPSELEVRHLRAFVALVDRGRVTAAARELGLAQSTVSDALAKLERAVGARVMVRGRGAQDAQLTAAGEALLPHARAILAAVDRAHLAVAGSTRTARSTFQIIANESVSTYVLPAALAHLRGRWPRTRFSVATVPCSTICEGVAAGAFDLGVMLDVADREHDVLARDVALSIFAQPSHPLARRMSLRRADLVQQPLFVSDATGHFHDLVASWLTRDRIAELRLEATGSVEGVKRAVLADREAAGVLPAFAIGEELRRGTLRRLEVHPRLPRISLYAVRSQARARHPAEAELLDALQRSA